jgi:hypothetical protein
MDHRLLLVKTITLLYRESLIDNQAENSANLVRTALENMQIKDDGLTLSKTNEILISLKATALEMCGNPIDHEYEKTELLQRLQMNCGEDTVLYSSLVQGLEPEMSESSLKRSVLNIRKSIQIHYREDKVDEIVNQAAAEFRFKRDKIKDLASWVSELRTKLETFEQGVNTKDPAIIDSVSMEDTEAVKRIYASVKEEDSGSTVLRTGWQGINRALNGGLRESDTLVALYALEHNYKTGFSLSIFKQVSQYNTPVVRVAGKKPLLLRISCEDSIKMNFKYLYKNLKENETGLICTTDGVTDQEMATYVTEKLTATGFSVEMIEINPHLWTYKDLCNKIVSYEAEGYEVKVVMLDYLAKIPCTYCDQGPAGTDLKNMFERVKSFMASRRIIFITPHQLSAEARRKMREDPEHFIHMLPGSGLFMGSSQLSQVTDLEIFAHITKVNRQAYLETLRGKHRQVGVTSDEHLYNAYQFVKNGVILDDIDGPDSSREKPGGPTRGQGGGGGFFQFNNKHAGSSEAESLF